MNIQKSNELQALTAEKMELLPLKNRVTELVSSIEILQNANAELNQRIALATQDTLKCMEVDHKNIEVEKSDLEASFGSQLSQKQNDIDRLNSQVLALQSTISQLEDQLSKRSIIPANDETSQLQLKVQYYEKKIADLLSTIEFAQQEQDGTSDALKEVSEQKIAAEESLKELKSGFDELQEKHAEVLKLLEIATANSESRIEEVRAQFLTQLKQSSSQIEQLQIKYEREKQELESEKLQLNASNSALRLELAKKIEELEALESGRCDGTKKVNDLIADVERLTEDCRSKSIGLDGALAEIATLARRNESNVAKIQELEYFLREKTDTATKALFACKELEQKLDALEEAKAEMKAKLNQLAAETKLDTDSQIDQLKKEYDTLRLKVVQLENESSELEELKNSSTTRISLLEEEKAALARQKDEINVQNSHFVKENAALKQNIQKLMEDMVKAKESAMTKPSKPAETAAVALPPATSRPTKKRPLANTTMLSIPEDKDSPMRFQSAVGAPEPKKSKPSPKQKDDGNFNF